MVERENAELPLTTQAELLGLSRASLYYVPVPPSPEELYIKRRIDEIYTAHPFYGSRKILAVLRREMTINRKAVQRHMREMGLAAIYPGPNLSKRAQQHAVFPYLLRGVAITRPNQVWGIDLTYIRLRGGWMYLVAVLDWFSRYVVSWELDQTLEMPFVLRAVERALTEATPEIWNSDQAAISPARNILTGCKLPVHRSVWTAAAVRSTSSSRRDWATSSASGCPVSSTGRGGAL